MLKEKIFLFLFILLVIFVSLEFFNLNERFLVETKKAESFFTEIPKYISLKKHSPYIKGIYINAFAAGSPEKMENLLNLIKTTELNAAIIDIKEVDGRITFDTGSALINSLGSERVLIPNLKEIINKFHGENIYLIARIAIFKDGYLPQIKPELALKNTKGQIWRDFSGKTWLDPAAKEVWDYTIEIAKETIKIGFDEVNFDYVRFPSDGDTRSIIYPIWDKKTPRAEIIKSFFAYLDKNLKQSGVFLSVDLFGLTMMREDDLNIGQILENAAPYFNFICPMVYPSHYPAGFEGYKNPAANPYEIIKMNLLKGEERIKNSRAKLRAWLQDFSLGAIYDKEMIELQKQAVYDTNSYGWLLWNPASRYTEEGLEKR